MSWKTLTNYYVYVYCKHDVPYYVGKGKGDRVVAKHLYVEVPSWENIKVFDNLNEDEAHKLEIFLIDFYGRKSNNTGILENLQRGGKTQKSGWFQSNDAKEKISRGNRGKKRTEAQLQNYKKPKSKTHRENIRLANIGRPRDGRYEKIGKTKSKQKWYNNGSITVMRIPGTEEDGFVPGRLPFKKDK